MEIRKALFYVRERGKMRFFVQWPDAKPSEGDLLRLARDEVSEEAELVTVSAKVYRDRRVVDFVGFLRKAVVTDPNGKVSPKSVWNAWTGLPADTAVSTVPKRSAAYASVMCKTSSAPYSMRGSECGADWTGKFSVSGEDTGWTCRMRGDRA